MSKYKKISKTQVSYNYSIKRLLTVVYSKIKKFEVNPLKGRGVIWLHFAILRAPDCRMSEIKNVG